MNDGYLCNALMNNTQAHTHTHMHALTYTAHSTINYLVCPYNNTTKIIIIIIIIRIVDKYRKTNPNHKLHTETIK